MHASQGIAPWRSTHDELGLGENSACFCEYVKQKKPPLLLYVGKKKIFNNAMHFRFVLNNPCFYISFDVVNDSL